METISSIETALKIFEEASTKQVEATEIGDYKNGNKNYDKIIKVISFLKTENSIESLLQYLSHSSIGVRLWSACYILPINEKMAIKVLENITKEEGIISLTAETTLNEWKKGNLKFQKRDYSLKIKIFRKYGWVGKFFLPTLFYFIFEEQIFTVFHLVDTYIYTFQIYYFIND